MPQSIAERERERLWRLAGMGATMTSEILAGAAIGWLLDGMFGTGPTILIVGTILGVVIGLGSFIRMALRETRRSGRDAADIAAHLGKSPSPREHDDQDEDER